MEAANVTQDGYPSSSSSSPFSFNFSVMTFAYASVAGRTAENQGL